MKKLNNFFILAVTGLLLSGCFKSDSDGVEVSTNEIMLFINGSVDDYFYQYVSKLLEEKYTKFESKDLIKLPTSVKLANVQRKFISPVKMDYIIFEFQSTSEPLDFLYETKGLLLVNNEPFRGTMNRYVYFKGFWYVENEYKNTILKQDAIKELNTLICSFNSIYEDNKVKEKSWTEK